MLTLYLGVYVRVRTLVCLQRHRLAQSIRQSGAEISEEDGRKEDNSHDDILLTRLIDLACCKVHEDLHPSTAVLPDKRRLLLVFLPNQAGKENPLLKKGRRRRPGKRRLKNRIFSDKG